MIKYALVCDVGHEFDAWFQSIASFETQEEKRLVVCPCCGSNRTEKAVSAPNISTGSADRPSGLHKDVVDLMRRFRAEVMATSDYVGPQFAAEARRIHENESEPRRIYGEASGAEVRALVEDGIPVVPVPKLPEDHN